MSLNTTKTTTAGTASARPALSAPAATKATAGVKARRRPLLFALMAALVAAGALLATYAYTSLNDTRAVLVVAQDVARGEVIEAEDLGVVRVSLDPALAPVSAGEEPGIVGSRAAVDLWTGALLTEVAFTDAVVPVVGDSLVGILLTAAQMPAEPLYAGDRVRIVSTPGDQGEVTEKEPVTIEAAVVGVGRVEATGESVIDVSVARKDSAGLAVRAATGRVALVLDSRER